MSRSSTQDADDDNRINLADFGVLVRHFGDTSASPDWVAARKADFDGDGVVGFDDFLLLADNFGRIGMEVRGAARAAAASSGAVWFESHATGPDALRGRDLGAIRGVTLVLPDGVSADAEGSVFTGADYEILTWPDTEGRRVAIALTGDRPVSGDGVLLRLQGLREADLGAVLGSVEVLDADGLSIRPAADRATPVASELHPNYPNPFNPSTHSTSPVRCRCVCVWRYSTCSARESARSSTMTSCVPAATGSPGTRATRVVEMWLRVCIWRA